MEDIKNSITFKVAQIVAYVVISAPILFAVWYAVTHTIHSIATL